MRFCAALLLILLSACVEERPPAPTAQENLQLDEAEAMLNDAGTANAAR